MEKDVELHELFGLEFCFFLLAQRENVLSISVVVRVSVFSELVIN